MDKKLNINKFLMVLLLMLISTLGITVTTYADTLDAKITKDILGEGIVKKEIKAGRYGYKVTNDYMTVDLSQYSGKDFTYREIIEIEVDKDNKVDFNDYQLGVNHTSDLSVINDIESNESQIKDFYVKVNGKDFKPETINDYAYMGRSTKLYGLSDMGIVEGKDGKVIVELGYNFTENLENLGNASGSVVKISTNHEKYPFNQFYTDNGKPHSETTFYLDTKKNSLEIEQNKLNTLVNDELDIKLTPKLNDYIGMPYQMYKGVFYTLPENNDINGSKFSGDVILDKIVMNKGDNSEGNNDFGYQNDGIFLSKDYIRTRYYQEVYDDILAEENSQLTNWVMYEEGMDITPYKTVVYLSNNEIGTNLSLDIKLKLIGNKEGDIYRNTYDSDIVENRGMIVSRMAVDDSSIRGVSKNNISEETVEKDKKEETSENNRKDKTIVEVDKSKGIYKEEGFPNTDTYNWDKDTVIEKFGFPDNVLDGDISKEDFTNESFKYLGTSNILEHKVRTIGIKGISFLDKDKNGDLSDEDIRFGDKTITLFKEKDRDLEEVKENRLKEDITKVKTDKDGAYELKNLDYGRYYIGFSKKEFDGYELTRYDSKDGDNTSKVNPSKQQNEDYFISDEIDMTEENIKDKYIETSEHNINNIHIGLVEETGKIIVKHITDEGKELKEPVEIEGKLGDSYKTKEEKFDGYEIKELPKNQTGVYKKEPVEVIYVYSKKKVFGELEVKYLDTEGNVLAEGWTKKEEVGTDYTTEDKKIDGYELKEMPKNKDGKYVEGLTEVIYIYHKKEVIPTPSTEEPVEETTDTDTEETTEPTETEAEETTEPVEETESSQQEETVNTTEKPINKTETSTKQSNKKEVEKTTSSTKQKVKDLPSAGNSIKPLLITVSAMLGLVLGYLLYKKK